MWTSRLSFRNVTYLTFFVLCLLTKQINNKSISIHISPIPGRQRILHYTPLISFKNNVNGFLNKTKQRLLGMIWDFSFLDQIKSTIYVRFSSDFFVFRVIYYFQFQCRNINILHIQRWTQFCSQVNKTRPSEQLKLVLDFTLSLRIASLSLYRGGGEMILPILPLPSVMPGLHEHT